ncbi:MAG TPA: hypothetical protein VM121_03460 [Acidimicrobiales bacterium]|nr:hypothetical protein [Acidimicrobiales bacterium]
MPVNGNGDYTSPPVAVTATGSYSWKAEYSGDQNNLGVQNPCQDADETSVIVQVTPTVVAQAAPPGPVNVGQPISGTATLSGASSPTGSITFKAFGPNDSTCAGAPIFSRHVQVTGIGNYSSGFFTPSAL